MKRKDEKESTADASNSQRRPDDLIPSAVQFSACNFGDDLLQFDFAAQCPISDLETFIQQASKRTRQVQNPGESTQGTLSCRNRNRCIHISPRSIDNASSTPSMRRYGDLMRRRYRWTYLDIVRIAFSPRVICCTPLSQPVLHPLVPQSCQAPYSVPRLQSF